MLVVRGSLTETPPLLVPNLGNRPTERGKFDPLWLPTVENFFNDVRCEAGIRHLLPKIAEGLPDDARFGGPLRTTFLLAMATPMIVLPVERIFKPGDPGAARAGDDRNLDPALAKELAGVLGNNRSFGDAPFVERGAWSYVQAYAPFNTAGAWPDELLEALSAPQAFEAAHNAPARRVLLDLRNALAHGGVAYLDEDGRNSTAQAAMFAFVSARAKDRQITGLNILRVHEDAFAAFLSAWTEWLGRRRRVLDALNESAPVAA